MNDATTTEPTAGTPPERAATNSGWKKAGDVAALPEHPAAPEPTPVETKEPFNPRTKVRRLSGKSGGADYLDVKWRLVWAREEHPDLQIITEIAHHEPGFALFKATVSYRVVRTLPNGQPSQLLDDLVVCTGYGSETKDDFGDYIEKAETKAVGRALHHLGYGTESMPEDAALADSPVAQNTGSQSGDRTPNVGNTVRPDTRASRADNRVQSDDARKRRAAMDLEITAQMKRTGAEPADAQDFCEEMFGTRDARKLNDAQMAELLTEFRQIPNDRFAELRKETAGA